MTAKVPISYDEIIEAVRKMKKSEREAFIEELLATTSPEYLRSIKEERAQYKAGKTKSDTELFGSRSIPWFTRTGLKRTSRNSILR